MFSVEGSPSAELYDIMERADGVSGRLLRKLPFRVYAENLEGSCHIALLTFQGGCSIEEFLGALRLAIEKAQS